MDEISDLRLFVRIVAAGNLSEAARQLNSSTPAMSRRLAAFEARLGVRLIERSSRRFDLTPEGLLLHERAVRIVAAVDAAESEARAHAMEPSGHLRICAPTQIGRQRVAAMMAAFLETFPQISCELVLSDAGLELVRDRFDFIFRTTMPSEPDAKVLSLLKGRRVVCASPAYFERHGVPRVPEDLLGHECIRLVRGYEVIDHWRFSVDGEPRELQVSGRLTSSSAEIVHGWALSGRGIAVKVSWDIEDDLDSGRLVECLSEFCWPQVNLYGVFPRTDPMPSRISKFIDFVSNQGRRALHM